LTRGARHGIKMNGKLARIEKMEQLEYERVVAEQRLKEDGKRKQVEEEIEIVVKKKKKKSKKNDSY